MAKNYFKYVWLEHTMVRDEVWSKFKVNKWDVFESWLDVSYMLKNKFVLCDKDWNETHPKKQEAPVGIKLSEMAKEVTISIVTPDEIEETPEVSTEDWRDQDEEEVTSEANDDPKTIEEARAYLKSNWIKFAWFQKLDSLLEMVKKHKESPQE